MKAGLALTAAVAACLWTAGASAQSTTLSTGTGDGSVSVTLTGDGSSANTGNGFYDPIGAGTPASTIFSSYLAYRVGTTGNRSFLTSSNLLSNGTTATSDIAGTGFTGTLTQSVAPTFQSGARTGSLLTQAYSFTNTSTSAMTLDLLRYLDGDLNFDGSLIDGGGRLTAPDGSPLLFEIDSATGASTSSTFVGIYNVGGMANGFQISLCCNGQLNSALDNSIRGDGNNDNFIDAGAGYDVTLNLANLLNLAVGGTQTLTTYTLFGSGAPNQVQVPGTPTSAVPEPASWAMMIFGIGAAGGSLRRRRRPVLAAA